MTEKKQINISLKYNLLVGVLTGLWLFLFLFLTKPFKQERLDNLHLLYLATSMSLVTTLSYFTSIIIQNEIYKKYAQWKLKHEIAILFIFLLLALVGTFFIYKSNIAEGSYSLPIYLLRDYLPTVLILLPITFILRKYFFKLSNNEINNNIIYIYGENKLDYLKMDKKDLISVSSSQNYVEICFLVKNQLHNKLIRGTLKKTQTNLPFLVQVHRSHLINPSHFISFKDKKILKLTMKEIPFSDTFRNNIIAN